MSARTVAGIAASLILFAFVATSAQAEAGTKPASLAKAVELRGESAAAFAGGDYDAAAELARRAKALLADLGGELPASYVVRLVVEDRDCLWKIAGLPFVYGDGNKWPILYRANKKTLKHPENEDLILPGEVLVIPSIAGESRRGAFDPSAAYPAFRSAD
jgi:nucleoid-associated protein YgaU